MNTSKIKIFLFAFALLSANIIHAQFVKGTGIGYSNGAPTHTPNTDTHSEFCIDTTNNKKIYLYDRDTAAWIVAGYFVQPTNVVGVPTHTPHDAQSIIAINAGDSLYHYRSGSWRLVSGGGTGTTDLTIGGSGPTFTIESSTGTDVTIGAGGIITLSESPANTLLITGTEVDGSITNEIQQIDTFEIASDSIRLSLSGDGVIYKKLFINDNSKSNEGSLVIGGSASTVTLSTNTIGSPVQTWVGSGNILVKDSSGYSVIVSPYESAVDTSYFHHQYGNSYGKLWEAGTNDNFGIELEIQDTATLSIATDQTTTLSKITSTNNAIVDQLVLDIQSHNATQGSFGNSILFKNELSNGTVSTDMARFGSYWTNPIAGTYEGAFTWQLGDFGGALTEVMKLDRTSSTGVLTIGTSAPIVIRPDYIEISQVSAPSTPATNYGRIYKFTDDSLYFVNEAGNHINLCRGTSGSAVTTNVLNLAGNTLTSTVEGIADTSLVIGELDISSATNTMTIEVNNITDNATIINSNVLSYGSVDGILTSTLNGVSDTTLITPSSDGNGIYSGDGSVPTGTLAEMSAITSASTFAIGKFRSFPSQDLDAREYGLFIEPGASGEGGARLFGADSAAQTFSYVKAFGNIGAFVSKVDLSQSTDLDQWFDYVELRADKGSENSVLRMESDSAKITTDQLRFNIDTLVISIAANEGTNGQVLTSNGYLATWSSLTNVLSYGTVDGILTSTVNGITDTTLITAAAYSDEQAQDAIGAMINGSLTYVDGTPLFHIADRDWGPFTSSSQGLVFGMDVGSIETSHILDSTILEVDLASNSVGSNAIKGGSVGTSEITDLSIVAGDIANNTITSTQVNDDYIFLQGGNTIATPGILGTNDNNGISFETNNITRMRLDTSSNLLIGASDAMTISNSVITALNGLTITGGDAVGDSIVYIPTTANATDAQGAHVFKVDNNGGTTAMTIRNNGNIGIGNPSPLERLNIGLTSAALSAGVGSEGVAITLSEIATAFGIENTAASGSTGGSGSIFYSNDGAAMVSGDRLGYIIFGGSSSSTSLRNTASVAAYAEETWVDATNYGSGIRFETTLNGGTTRNEKFRIVNDGSTWQNCGSFSAIPDAIRNEKVLRKAITGTAASELFVNGSSLQALLPSTNAIWNVSIDLVAVCTAAGNGTTTAGEAFIAKRYCGISRIGSTTALIGTVETLGTDKSNTTMSTSATTITADDTNEALKITFTPPSTAGSTTTFRVVATYRIVQVQY